MTAIPAVALVSAMPDLAELSENAGHKLQLCRNELAKDAAPEAAETSTATTNKHD
jgi:hypothetical protein